MGTRKSVNDLVIRFSNVNGTGSASANKLFAKTIFRMGIPVSPKNIFPSNIQGLPTWYEIRVNEKGFLGRRDGIDILVSVNPQSLQHDIDSVRSGGYLIYDCSKKLHDSYLREDINFIGIPMMQLSAANFEIARLQQLFKNVIYVGALVALLDMDEAVIRGIIEELFAKKQKLIPDNMKALDLGLNYIRDHTDSDLPYRLQSRDLNKGKILVDGNTACAIGAVYGGATVASWYPITPSTSVIDAFSSFSKRYRTDQETGKRKYAIVQAEDELAAIGMVIGAAWNGARAFTATSGPGLSLMNEFLGLAYFAEIPSVLIDVQRGGPSTGMPTRTQQSDILEAAYASHGDTKHVLLFPANPKECFEDTALALDLADRLQTPVIVMSDLDLGMNEHVSDAFEWDDNRSFDRGKILSAEELDQLEEYGRYLDVDGDGIPYRTIPGTHPTKGAFFTRGTSKDEMARYTEMGDAYQRNVDRLIRKFATAEKLLPQPVIHKADEKTSLGIMFFGTSTDACLEALELLKEDQCMIDALQIRGFPFNNEIKDFIQEHERVFLVEQNRDAQMKALFMIELQTDPNTMISILNYDGYPITADYISREIKKHLSIQAAHTQ